MVEGDLQNSPDIGRRTHHRFRLSAGARQELFISTDMSKDQLELALERTGAKTIREHA